MAAGDLSSMRPSSQSTLSSTSSLTRLTSRSSSALRGGDGLTGDAHLGQHAARQQAAEHAEHLCGKEADLHLGQAEHGLAAGHGHVAHRR